MSSLRILSDEEKKLNDNEKKLSEKRSEADLAAFATKTLDFLMSHYAHSWKQGIELINVETQLRCWMSSLEGITHEQVDYAKRKISRGECFYERPINPGQFRLLCNSMPDIQSFKPAEPNEPNKPELGEGYKSFRKTFSEILEKTKPHYLKEIEGNLSESIPDEPFKAKPWVKAVNEKIPSASPTFNPDYDIGWFCGLPPEGKTKVYEGALKAYPALEEILKFNKETVLDVGFERSSWFKPIIESFRGYWRL